MKKFILFILTIVLCGCQKNVPTLHVFYTSTCSECLLLQSDFLAQVDDSIEVQLHNMDKQESIDLYKQVLDRLENVDVNLYDQPLTPMIYLEDGFAAVGYMGVMKDIYNQLIEETLQNRPYSIIPSGVWIEEE